MPVLLYHITNILNAAPGLEYLFLRKPGQEIQEKAVHSTFKTNRNFRLKVSIYCIKRQTLRFVKMTAAVCVTDFCECGTLPFKKYQHHEFSNQH